MLDFDGLYAAVEDDAAFARLADNVAAACGTRSAMVTQFSADGALRLAQMNYWPLDEYWRYYEAFADADPWREAASAIGIAGRAVAFDQVLPPEQFVRTAMFNELFLTIGDDTGRCMGVLPAPGAEPVLVAVHRAVGDAAFAARDRERLDLVYGHVVRVLRLRQLLAQERGKALRLQDMLDRSGEAMLLVDRRLRIAQASDAAIAWLNRRDGACFRNGLLAFATVELEQAVRAAVAATIDRRPVARFAFLCPRPSGQPPLRLAVLPAGSARGADPDRRWPGAAGRPSPAVADPGLPAQRCGSDARRTTTARLHDRRGRGRTAGDPRDHPHSAQIAVRED